MADDVTLNSMSGGSKVATDETGTGEHVQIVKLAQSADGSRTPVAADSDGLKVKVSNASIPVTDNGGSLTVDGTLDLSVSRVLPSSWNTGDKGVPAAVLNSDGSSWSALSLGANGGLMVETVPYVPLLVTGPVSQDGAWTVTATAGTGTLAVIERGATIGSTSASVTTTSGQIVAASATRRTIVLTNLGTDYVWVGASGVTDNQGIRLAPGQALTIDKSPTAAVHAKAATGTQTVAIFTESD